MARLLIFTMLMAIIYGAALSSAMEARFGHPWGLLSIPLNFVFFWAQGSVIARYTIARRQLEEFLRFRSLL